VGFQAELLRLVLSSAVIGMKESAVRVVVVEVIK